MARRLAAGLLAARPCWPPRAPVTPGAVKVVAGENSWGNIAAQIGGPHVQVTSIQREPLLPLPLAGPLVRQAGCPVDVVADRQH